MKKFLAICLSVCLLAGCHGALAAVSFEDSAIYNKLAGTFGGTFSENSLVYGYNADTKVWSFIIDAPEGSAVALELKNEVMLASWQKLRETLEGLMETTADLLEEAGYGSVLCLFMLRSDVKEDSILYLNLNGTTLYDAADALSD